jgi:L-ascorbate metabolism protein UlaG (beta-lactamase superfamily)
MEIQFLGQASFRLKGRTTSVVTDPFDPEFVGLKLPKLEADIVTISHDHGDHNNSDSVEGAPFIITGPGEYEIKGTSVVGVKSWHDDKGGADRGANTLYNITIDGINVAHLGDLGQKELTQNQVEQLGTVDILLLPVGSVYTIDASVAAKITAQLEPKVIIPMHYLLDGLKLQLDPVDKFLAEMGQEQTVREPKLTITADRLPEEPKVIVLEKI